MYTQRINYGMTEEYFGLSTDTKPTQADNGDLLTEIDTGKKFRFDEQNGTWHEQPGEGSGGGGSGSDAFIVTITYGEAGSVSLDKTFEEISNAWDLKRNIIFLRVMPTGSEIRMPSVAQVMAIGPALNGGYITLAPELRSYTSTSLTTLTHVIIFLQNEVVLKSFTDTHSTGPMS